MRKFGDCQFTLLQRKIVQHHEEANPIRSHKTSMDHQLPSITPHIRMQTNHTCHLQRLFYGIVQHVNPYWYVTESSTTLDVSIEVLSCIVEISMVALFLFPTWEIIVDSSRKPYKVEPRSLALLVLCIMSYTVKECLRIAYIIGVHPMMNSKCQLMLHIAISIGAWLSIYLALSLLIYKEEKLTVSDFIETFSGISMLIHLLELAANSFWSPDTIKLSPEVMEYAKRYHYRLKWVYRLFFVSCIFNTLEFCYRTFFVDEDILVIQYWKPDWMPFYPFWLFQVLVMNFGVMFPIICLDTLIMTILVLTQIQFKLLSDELENLFSSKNTRQTILSYSMKHSLEACCLTWES
ncbi:unnamed protein product [Callosobruchus maculatus]|uniref:Odorant receptor n=1 Tax=Callosobruchus maculatus TaxID=64391 RepID=A0A653CTA5_CALMS|nr:unnamed protein product [Callosobruchus maculatus]